MELFNRFIVELTGQMDKMDMVFLHLLHIRRKWKKGYWIMIEFPIFPIVNRNSSSVEKCCSLNGMSNHFFFYFSIGIRIFITTITRQCTYWQFSLSNWVYVWVYFNSKSSMQQLQAESFVAWLQMNVYFLTKKNRSSK